MKIVTNKQGEVSIKGLYGYLKKYYKFFKRYLEKTDIKPTEDFSLSLIEIRNPRREDQYRISDVIDELKNIDLCIGKFDEELDDYNPLVNVNLSYSKNIFKLFDIWKDPNDFELSGCDIGSVFTDFSLFIIEPKTPKGEEILALFMLEGNLGN